MDLSSLRALVADVNFGTLGVDILAAAPGVEAIATRGIWQTPQVDDFPSGLDLRRREARRAIAIHTDAGLFPLRSIVLAPLEIGGVAKYWEVDGFDPITTDHVVYRVIPLSYPSAVIASGADHYWRLDERTIGDPVLDTATGSTIGTYPAAGVAPGAPGALSSGTAAEFVNADQIDGVYNGANKLLLAAASTIAAWIKPIGGGGTILSYRNAGLTVKPWIGLAGAKLRIETTRASDLDPTTVESSSALPLDEWAFVVWTSDGAAGDGAMSRLYINGTIDQVAVQPKSGSWTGPATIGFDLGTALGFDGTIDEVSTWSRELSALEIAGLYAAARVRS